MAHECRHGFPCFGLSACYGHLKAAALNGGRDKLTDEERAFVGGAGYTAGSPCGAGSRCAQCSAVRPRPPTR